MPNMKAQIINDLIDSDDLTLMEPEDSAEPAYGLEEDLHLSPEELRRDRLAHLFLTGLRLVMEDEQNQG